MSTTPTPSADRSGGGKVLSSMPGGAGGEPLKATKSLLLSGLTLIPRGRFPSGRVEITSQNHGFVVVPESLPDDVDATHVSLFDGTIEGIALRGKPVFSVQHHPEASPGPQDSHYLFERFIGLMEKA